jgi:trigger factor
MIQSAHMKYTTARLADNSIELTITLPWMDIEKTYEEVVGEFVKNAEMSGFRKGKAPRDIVEKSLDK